MKSPILSVVVISYNTKALTIQTVRSIFVSLQTKKLPKTKVEVIVVDNHSTDGSIPELKRDFGKRIRLIENKLNIGFARANNLGAKEAKGKYLLLLNSDTVVHPGALETMIECLDSHVRIGIVAASLSNLDGSYQPQGGALPTLRNLAAWWLWPFPGIFPGVAPYQDPSLLTNKDFVVRGWVGGTALMMKRGVYEAVGGLDEKIFMYAEDVDLCLRINRAGLKVGICSEATITHLGSASSSSVRAMLGEIKGIIYLFKKHKPELHQLLLRILLIKGAILRFLYFGILKGKPEARGLYLKVIYSALQ